MARFLRAKSAIRLAAVGAAVAASATVFAAPASARPRLYCRAGGRGGWGGDGGISVGGNGGLAFTIGGGFANASGGNAGSARGGTGGRGGTGVLPVCNQNTNGYVDDDGYVDNTYYDDGYVDRPVYRDRYYDDVVYDDGYYDSGY